MVGAEQPLGALDRELLDFVDHLGARMIASPWIAFGGQGAQSQPLGGQDLG